MIMRILLLFLILLATCQIYANNKVNTQRLKKGAQGETWQHIQKYDLSMPAALMSVRSQMQKLGYKEKHEIKLDEKGFIVLLLFEKSGQQRLFMLRRINVDSTECSWGDINVKK